MERVEFPMDPVEPRMASFFTSSIFADSRIVARKRDAFLESAKCLDFQPALITVRGAARSLGRVDDYVGRRAA